MARVRARCFHLRISSFSFFRRLPAHVRRPYFLLVFGMVLLLVSIASLHTRKGVERMIANPWGNRLLYNNNTQNDVLLWPTSREGSLSTLSTPNTSLLTDVSLMEARLKDMQKRIKTMGFGIRIKANETQDRRYQFRDLSAMQAERQDRIRHVCDVVMRQRKNKERTPGATLYHEGWYGKKFHHKVIEVYRPQNFLFCPVLKVGSTFFRRLFYALGYGLMISSPYDIPIKTALRAYKGNLDEVYTDHQPSMPRLLSRHLPGGRQWHLLGERLLPSPPPFAHRLQRPVWARDTQHPRKEAKGVDPEKRVADFLQNSGKVMFTREPYSKLLSGYVDKLFAPNPYFWKTVGRYIIRQFRHNPSSVSLTCGHDVTFPEFIKYVIRNEHSNDLHRDTHFVPSYDQCKPCDYNYDVVGKMETFSQDASLVLAQLGFNLSQSTLKEWSRESEFDAIEDSITSPYGWRKDVVKCISWEQANKRIWRKLQIRGILDRSESLPSNFKQYSSSSSTFIRLVKRSWERFRMNHTKPRQKADALSSAYSLVPREDLELIREYFLLDFDLFGYDSRPAKIFQAKNTWDVFNLTN